jgi:hypothetical protein
MSPQLKTQGGNIVLRGQFNPAIFHPAWLSAQNLIRQQEADAANIQIIHPDATIFDVEWLQLRVTQDRFQATTVQEAYYEVLRDLVIGVFSILNHTPLSMMGINWNFHYALGSEKVWHAVGDRLAPKQDWQALLKHPGMRSLTIQGERPDELPGYIRVKVEPSPQIQFGLYVDINDHYELSPGKPPSPAIERTSELINPIAILSERWEKSMHHSVDIARRITNLGAIEK